MAAADQASNSIRDLLGHGTVSLVEEVDAGPTDRIYIGIESPDLYAITLNGALEAGPNIW